MNNRVLIGSRAIAHHFPDFKRTPKDYDYAVASEAHKVPDSDSMVIPLVCKYSTGDIASPEMLLTLKMSHLFWNELGEANWEKHMHDVQFLLSKGVTYFYGLMLELKKFWTEHYKGLYRSNLSQSKDDFFNNALEEVIEHDTIHTFLNPVPMYTRVLKENCEVELDETKFYALTHEEKLKFIQEEVMVMAWERWREFYHRKSYYRMLKKFLRNHVPMFAFTFLIENWRVLDRPPYDFNEVIENNLKEHL